MDNTHSINAKIFKAFSDETRLMVLSLLQDGEKCANDLLKYVSTSQSTLSHHMKILVESSIVIARKDGKWMYYSINLAECQKAVILLHNLTSNMIDTPKSNVNLSGPKNNTVPTKTVAVQLM